MPIKIPLQARFWSKSKKKNSCLEWTATLFPNGYPQFWLNGTFVYGHRLAYKLAYGSIPKGMCVCHKCDNKKCIYPNHLFLGSISDNTKDAFKKGRMAKGETIGSSRLKEWQVIEIRKNYIKGKWGGGYDKIAEKYNVTFGTIASLIKRRTWKHI